MQSLHSKKDQEDSSRLAKRNIGINRPNYDGGANSINPLPQPLNNYKRVVNIYNVGTNGSPAQGINSYKKQRKS